MATNVEFNIIARDLASSALSHAGAASASLGSKLASLAGTAGSLGLVSGELGAVMDRVSAGLEAAGGSHDKLSKRMIVTGGVAAGVGAGLTAMASKDVEAQNQLATAVENTGKGYDGFGAQVDALISKQVKFGNTDDEVKGALQKLTQSYNDPKKALEQMGLVTDLAAAKHISLGEAATMVAKAHGGAAKVFKEFGINVKDITDLQKEKVAADKALGTSTSNLTKAQKTLTDLETVDAGKKKLSIADQLKLRDAKKAVADATNVHADAEKKATAATDAAKGATSTYDKALSQLSDKVKGQATAAQDSFGGKLREVKAWLENAASSIGEKYGPSITAAGAALTILATITDSAAAKTVALKIAHAAGAVATGAMTAAQWLLNAAHSASPIGLVIVALALLVAGLIIAYNNSQTFRDVVTLAFDGAKVGAQQMAKVAVAAFAFMASVFMALASALVSGAAQAFGWVPGLGPKLQEAANNMETFKNETNTSLSKVQDQLQVSIDTSQAKMAADQLAAYYHSRDWTVTATANVRMVYAGAGVAVPAGHAAGGRDIPAGLSWVGEQGPELVYIPGGSNVYSNPESKAMIAAAAAEGPTTFNLFDVDGTLMGTMRGHAAAAVRNAARASSVAMQAGY